MVEDFLKEYAKLISDSPDIIRTERINLGENFDEIIIYASKADTGKLIGKDGKMIINNALCNGCTLCQNVCKFDAIRKVGGDNE